MDSIRDYAVSVLAVSLICAVISGILRNTAAGNSVKAICGMVLTIVIASPLVHMDLSAPLELTASFSDAAQAAVQRGEDLSREALCQVIKQKTQTYILDKAAELGAEISVEITLTRDDPPLPHSAILSGTISPQGKQKLQQILQTQLGIEKENVQWIG